MLDSNLDNSDGNFDNMMIKFQISLTLTQPGGSIRGTGIKKKRV